MEILRNIISRLAWALLPIALVSFGLLISIWTILNNPGVVKESLDKSGLYSSSATSLLSTISSQTDLNTANLDWDDPAVKRALAKAFPPSMIESQSDTAIDSIYDWTKGESERLSFTLDFSEAKNNFATYISEYIRDRVNGLPACPLSTTLTADTNPFTATCRPYGITGDMAAAAIKLEVSQSRLFEDSKLSANEVSNGAGEPLESQLQILPDIYNTTKLALVAAATIIVSCSVLLLFWSREQRLAIKKLSKLYIVSGAIGLLLALLTGALIKTVATWEYDDASEVDGAIFKAVASLGNSLQSTWLLWSAVVLLIGIAGIVWLRFRKAPVSQPQ